MDTRQNQSDLRQKIVKTKFYPTISEKGTRVQLIFARGTLIGFYFRDDCEEILRSADAADGGSLGQGRSQSNPVTQWRDAAVVHERGKSEISILLKREGK